MSRAAAAVVLSAVALLTGALSAVGGDASATARSALEVADLANGAAGPPSALREQVVARRGGTRIRTEAALRSSWADPTRTRIDLGADIVLRDCFLGDPIRESPYPLTLDGHGHTIRQSCFEKRVLRQDGTGWLDLRDVTLTRGGSDGPGAALTSRGEIMLRDCAIEENLAEEPGGGVFSMRRVTVHRCTISGNLANDDGGGVYARRGGVQVYDSVLSANLVDGSGGAIGSTGDILVVDSKVDGNTTDGDGGALYADEDGDVTVIRSLIDGSDADGPGGAIFTLDGDVAVYDSTLIGNRADDRGGAIAGEADVLVVNSTIARNLAVAHAGGGVWARGDLALVNTTVTNNYAEGEGGGLLAAGRATLVYSTLVRNIAPVGGDVGAAGVLSSFGTILGPPVTEGVTGDTIPTRRSCRVYRGVSRGYNFRHDDTCGLDGASDITGTDPELAALEDDPQGFVLEPEPGSPVRARIPSGSCRAALPRRIPAAQLLEGWVDWSDVLARDALGHLRDTGQGCDIGAVQSGQAIGPGASRASRPRGRVGPTRTDADSPVAGRATLSGPPASTRSRAAPRSGPDGPAAALEALQGRLGDLRRGADRFGTLLGCTTRVGASEVGDERHRWGFLYDERDGTGTDLRPALALEPSAPDWFLLALDTSRRCLSRAADPNGAGEDPRLAAGVVRRTSGDEGGTSASDPVRDLLHRLHRLEGRADAVEERTERFDAWESCLSWLPVTEDGDVDQRLGFLRPGSASDPVAYGAAVHLDHSEWDDPDYQVLAFGRDDRPFADGDGDCGTDPGEAADRTVVPTQSDAGDGDDEDEDGAWADLNRGISELRERVEDLGEPVDEISRFDQCLYTVGLTSLPDYRFRSRHGTERLRPALAFDLRGAHLPELSVMAFPGEEPPQIECNEDAGGVQTDE